MTITLNDRTIFHTLWKYLLFIDKSKHIEHLRWHIICQPANNNANSARNYVFTNTLFNIWSINMVSATICLLHTSGCNNKCIKHSYRTERNPSLRLHCHPWYEQTRDDTKLLEVWLPHPEVLSADRRIFKIRALLFYFVFIWCIVIWPQYG